MAAAHTKFSSSSGGTLGAPAGTEGTGERERGTPPLAGPHAESHPRLTCADAWVANSNGAAQEAGGLAQVTGGDVGNVVVTTELLAGAGRHRAGRGATHHAVCAARLIHEARLRARAHYMSAGLCRPERGRVSCQMAPSPGESSYPQTGAPPESPAPRILNAPPLLEPRPRALAPTCGQDSSPAPRTQPQTQFISVKPHPSETSPAPRTTAPSSCQTEPHSTKLHPSGCLHGYTNISSFPLHHKPPPAQLLALARQHL